ncbi:MAG: 4-hydroxybenzoate octaprenyltransferase [Minwuiales bacterium]|nr:4-hydroxybenzoate octaprenyltransferase [Minwuiales bacterium]
MNHPSQTIADAQVDNWVDRLAPPPFRPYFKLARLDRPIGTWLLLWPCWWSIALAAPAGTLPDLWLLALFGIGALVMRGAGCTFNDIVDRDFDSRVERTRLRPIPAGQVNVKQAVAWMVFLSLIGFVILLQFNAFAIGIGIASLALVAAYPFMKRITYWPQAWLGLTFNWGALLGWAAVAGNLGPVPLTLYAAGLFWTLGYDTIYAHQDKEDDALIGVKSTALKLGRRTRPWLFVFYGVAIAGIAAAGFLAGMAWPFYLGLTIAAGHLAWQAARVDIDDSADCLAKFQSNTVFGWLLFGAIIAGGLTA